MSQTPWFRVIAQDLYAIRGQAGALESDDGVRKNIEKIVAHAFQALDICAAQIQDVSQNVAGKNLPSDGF